LNSRIVKSNIKKTLFFSYSVIFSTIFFLTYLSLKTECRKNSREINALEKSRFKYSNNVKSLKRKKNILLQSVEDLATQNYSFIIPDPQPFIIIMNESE